ncbi:MAG: hypothetical protein ACLVCH_16030 [Roseburia inulinivorans]
MDLEGQTGFYKITTGNKLETWNPNEGQENFYNQMMKLVTILAVTLVIMILAIVLVVRMDKNRKERSHPFGLENRKFPRKHPNNQTQRNQRIIIGKINLE